MFVLENRRQDSKWVYFSKGVTPFEMKKYFHMVEGRNSEIDFVDSFVFNLGYKRETFFVI